MNVDHIKLTIPLESNGKKYHLTVELENPGHEHPVYWAYGEGHINPMESPCGFGDTPDRAIEMFFETFDLWKKELKA
jgi:hypothetical protein